MRKNTLRFIGAAALGVITLSIATVVFAAKTHAPLSVMPQVDLPRYMGRWYVIACIPTRLERDAYDAVEIYELRPDGKIATTFTVRKGSHTAPIKTYRPVGSVRDASNARWGMQFIWPIKADYDIAYLDEGYSVVIVARQARDYVWVMSRTPTLSKAVYDDLVMRVASLGYDTSKLRLMPQAGSP